MINFLVIDFQCILPGLYSQSFSGPKQIIIFNT